MSKTRAIETLSEAGAALGQWLRPSIELVQRLQEMDAAISHHEETADDYDERQLEWLLRDERARRDVLVERLAWYRRRVLRLISATDWSESRSTRDAREVAINRYYRGLPLSGKSSAMCCAALSGKSAGRVSQLQTIALNRMAAVWQREDPPWEE